MSHKQLSRLTLLINPQIIDRAIEERQPPLRVTGTIHLAAALSVRAELGAVFVYDTALHATARAQNLNALAPA